MPSLEIIALIIASVTALASIALNFAQRKQAKADAAGIITDAALSLIKPLEDRIDEQDIEIEKWREKFKELEQMYIELERKYIEVKQENDKLKNRKIL